MSENGVFQVSRKIFKNDILDEGPFTKREAFLWLIAEAAFKPKKRHVGGRTFELERGQLVHSIRFMARAWQWDKSRVLRFLKRLRKENMIYTETETASETVSRVITICNYKDYQFQPNWSETAVETEARQYRDKLEKGNKEINNKSTSVPYGRARDFEDRSRADPEAHERNLLNRDEGMEGFQKLADLLRERMH